MNKTKYTFIDLGLPSGKLWATENVKDENGDENHFTFDEAVETFGENLPSKEDWKELFDNCKYRWDRKHKGYDITGPNGNTIFLPAAGYRKGVSMDFVGSVGYYWTSSAFDENSAYRVCFLTSYLYPQNFNYRYFGFSVRLVQ